MDDKIRRAYPGGPRKRDQEGPGKAPSRPVELGRAQDYEDRLHRSRRRAQRKRRRNRMFVGFVTILVIAGSVGFWMGLQSNRTSEELASEQERGGSGEVDLTRERNLILQQLWLMEDLERAPRR